MGTESVFTTYKGGQVMFHVSTLLPYNAKHQQQLERKCHLGNDIVMIVFEDGNVNFSADEIASQFNSGFIVVRPSATRGTYTYVVPCTPQAAALFTDANGHAISHSLQRQCGVAKGAWCCRSVSAQSTGTDQGQTAPIHLGEGCESRANGVDQYEYLCWRYQACT
jgi:hypothetical protein